MKDLYSVFQGLPTPKTTQEHVYSAVPIQGFESHRIAKDYQAKPCVLIAVNPTSKKFAIPLQQLYNLSITHNLTCEVHTDNQKEVCTFSVIRYAGDDEELKKYFLKVCDVLMLSLGNTPDNQQITHVVNKFIELFKSLKEPSPHTLQGLWAELFVIHQSKNPKALVKAWHLSPQENYDFSFNTLRIEIKSANTRHRTHHFSMKQLAPPAQCELYIASLFVEVLAGGKSIEDLINNIIERLDHDTDLIKKLHLITLATLGSSLDKLKSIGYDEQLAKESLRLYHANDIPKIESVPPNVFNLKFQSAIDSIVPSKENIDTLIYKKAEKKHLFFMSLNI